MSVIDLVTKAVSRPAGRVVEAPVREIVEEALRHANLASPQDVQAARTDLTKLSAQLHELRNQLGSLTDAVRGMQGEIEEASAAAKEASRKADAALALAREGEVHDLARQAATQAQSAQSALGELRQRLERLETPSAPHRAEEHHADSNEDDDGRPGRKSLEHLGCRVGGCAEPHRSKGFCSRHYQSWRRGRLEGFVAPTGLIEHEGHTYRVAESLEAEAFLITGKGRQLKIKIGKSQVDFEHVH